MTNIALRNCVDVDAYLVSAVKAVPTVIVLGPLIGWLALRSDTPTPQPSATTTSDHRSLRETLRTRRIPQFVLASFLAQFLGNAAFQKALEHIGLAASVPITLGVLIVGGAILGAVMLKEPVGSRKMMAIATLILAVIVLSLPDQMTGLSEPSGAAQQGAPDAMQIIIGSLWAALSGLAYSFFGVTLRQTLQTGLPAHTLMFISGLTGTITLWAFCFATLGLETITQTSPTQWGIMVTAGFCNFSAFVAITTSLRLLPVVAVNLINASQVAMAAVAGVLLFGEPITFQLVFGILLTLAGLMILARRTRAPIVITD